MFMAALLATVGKVEMGQISTDGWTDEHNVAYPYNGMLRKEMTYDTCYGIV